MTLRHVPITLFTILDAAIILWVAVAILLLLRYFMHYKRAMHIIVGHTKNADSCAQHMLLDIKKQTGKEIDVTVLFCLDTDIPFGLGIMHKRILMPERKYDDEELRYILLHEYIHFCNHDIVVKVMVSLFCIIFWWNPFVYLLKKDLEQALEIKCDLTVIKMLGEEEKAPYLQAIIDSLKKIVRKHNIPYASTALLRNGQAVEIKERFRAVMHYCTNGNRKQHSKTVIFAGVVFLVISYIFLPQPKFTAPVNTRSDIVNFDSSNAYIERKRDGSYWMYGDRLNAEKISLESAIYLQENGFEIIMEDDK